MVLRLNGGGDLICEGAVDCPAVVVVVWPPVGVVGPVLVETETLLGDTSGEKMTPSEYSDRLRPYAFVRTRSTSRISTSTTISARGLSFCWMIFSMICTTDVVARTVIEFAVLCAMIASRVAMPGSRMIDPSVCTSSVASACDT